MYSVKEKAGVRAHILTYTICMFYTQCVVSSMIVMDCQPAIHIIHTFHKYKWLSLSAESEHRLLYINYLSEWLRQPRLCDIRTHTHTQTNKDRETQRKIMSLSLLTCDWLTDDNNCCLFNKMVRFLAFYLSYFSSNGDMWKDNN